MAETVLVTGSNSGFGRLIVETLARQGYIVFAGMRATSGRNAPAAEELLSLADREQLALHIVELDVTDDASVERAITSVIAATGRLDVVVNNAGMAYIGPLEAYTPEQVQQQFETNVFGILRVNRAALPQMRQQGSGLLLQIGSLAGRMALPFQGLYGATKFALEGLTESYRDELAPFGIDAALIEPGTYPTPIMAKLSGRGRYRARCPVSDRDGGVHDAVLRGEPIGHASQSPRGGRCRGRRHRPSSRQATPTHRGGTSGAARGA